MLYIVHIIVAREKKATDMRQQYRVGLIELITPQVFLERHTLR